jgi:hypothetical protein
MPPREEIAAHVAVNSDGILIRTSGRLAGREIPGPRFMHAGYETDPEAARTALRRYLRAAPHGDRVDGLAGDEISQVVA